jgi:major membrane immunogen (membrane-anchored lipoprotein)
MRRYFCSFLTMILAATLLAACGSSDKGPAEAALKAAEEAINSARGEISKYMPDQASSLDSALAATREKFNKGDYKAVLADAPALTSKAQELTTAAAAKKAELTKSWEDLSTGLPRVVDAIKSRVDILSQSKKLPAGVTADNLAAAKSGLAEINQQWTAATEASKGGNLMDAMAKATAVKRKAAEVLTALNMPVPEALKS